MSDIPDDKESQLAIMGLGRPGATLPEPGAEGVTQSDQAHFLGLYLESAGGYGIVSAPTARIRRVWRPVAY